jgi:trans-aconitate 2-methyltransferase
VALPRPQEQAAHRLLLDTAADGPWAERLTDALKPMPQYSPQDYYDWLSPLAVSVDLWETEYHHVLSGDTPILQWLRAAALTPVMDRLDGPELDQFLAAYRVRLEAAYPEHPYGNTLVPTRHLFIVARVAG